MTEPTQNKNPQTGRGLMSLVLGNLRLALSDLRTPIRPDPDFGTIEPLSGGEHSK